MDVKPRLFKISLTVIGLILVLVIFLQLSLNSLIKKGVEKVGSRVTGTSVTLEAVSVSPFSGQGKIQGLVIGNPWETPVGALEESTKQIGNTTEKAMSGAVDDFKRLSGK